MKGKTRDRSSRERQRKIAARIWQKERWLWTFVFLLLVVVFFMLPSINHSQLSFVCLFASFSHFTSDLLVSLPRVDIGISAKYDRCYVCFYLVRFCWSIGNTLNLTSRKFEIVTKKSIDSKMLVSIDCQKK